jgi:hypothetical protein
MSAEDGEGKTADRSMAHLSGAALPHAEAIEKQFGSPE